MPWIVKRTDTFLPFLKPHRHNRQLLDALDNKIKHLMENPIAVGGELAGALHGKRSTRLIRKFRLIFSLSQEPPITAPKDNLDFIEIIRLGLHPSFSRYRLVA